MTQNLTRKVIGAQLAQARRRRGWRLQDVADRTAKQAARLSELETGKANSTIDTLTEAGDAVGLQLMFIPDEKVEAVMKLIGESRPVAKPAHNVPSVFDEVFIMDDDEEAPHAG